MKATRTILAIAMTAAAMLTLTTAAQAQNLGKFRHVVGKHFNAQVNVGRGVSIQLGHGHVRPPAYCPPKVCPPVRPPVICPPPVCFKYCVYLYDCHYGWRLHRCFYSHWQADASMRQLRAHGYRVYLRKVPVRHPGPGIGGPGIGGPGVGGPGIGGPGIGGPGIGGPGIGGPGIGVPAARTFGG